jgi:hypothetical protein
MPRRNGIAGDDYARKLGIQNELASGWEGTQDDIVFVVPSTRSKNRSSRASIKRPSGLVHAWFLQSSALIQIK